MVFDDIVLAAFLRERSFTFQYYTIVDEEMFDSYPHKICVSCLTSYIRQYNDLPTEGEMNYEVHKYCTKYRIDSSLEESVMATLSKCSQMSFNLEYVRDIFIRFATKNKLTSAILEGAQILKDKGDQIDDRDYEHIQDIITTAVTIKSKDTEGLMFGDVADNPSEYILSKSRFDPTTVIPTGIKTFDKGHIAGGPVPGEMYVISAPPGRGKSTVLINIGVSAILRGKDVVHIFVGDNTEADGVLRYSSRLTGLPMSQIMMNSSDYLPLWSKLKENFHLGNLLLGAYPIGGPTVSDLRSFITKNMIQRKMKPELLIVDYVDNCRRTSSKSSYDDLGDMYAQLKNIAEEMKMVVWTASQPKVDTWDSNEAAGLSSLSESSKKQHHVDGMLTMKKVNEGSYQIYVPKVRRGRSDYTIDLTIDWERMLIRESLPARISTPMQSQSSTPTTDTSAIPSSPF